MAALSSIARIVKWFRLHNPDIPLVKMPSMADLEHEFRYAQAAFKSAKYIMKNGTDRQVELVKSSDLLNQLRKLLKQSLVRRRVGRAYWGIYNLNSKLFGHRYARDLKTIKKLQKRYSKLSAESDKIYIYLDKVIDGDEGMEKTAGVLDLYWKVMGETKKLGSI